MSFPSRIGIATRGYRTGNSNPGRICIATYGYRCPEGIPIDAEIGDGGHAKGHGHVIQERTPTPKRDLKKTAILAVIAIQGFYE